MENWCLEGTDKQSVTSPGGEALDRDVHMSNSKRNRKFTHRFEPSFADVREWKSDAATSLVYMIQYGYYDRNLNMYEILSLLDDFDTY